MHSKKLKSYWLLPILVVMGLYQMALIAPTSVPVNETAAELASFIEKQNILPRYVEAGYSPLGRAPAVDAVLGDPYYLPVYAQQVSEEIKRVSEEDRLLALSESVFRAGGIPFTVTQETISIDSVPKEFLKAFGEPLGKAIYRSWKTFIAVSHKSERALSKLTEDEKEWLRNNIDSFFFGNQEKASEYDFFTTSSSAPFQFFLLASKVDLPKLTECACQLGAIVDDLHQLEKDLAVVNLPKDFVWEEEGFTFITSTRDHVVHNEKADFFIDLGGKNIFLNGAGGNEGKRPAALHVDLFGENTYLGQRFVQGSGILGVGVFASFAGQNTFTAQAYSQGCGFFGVGMLMNLSGKNRFEMNFGGQSFATFGASLLWNKVGNNDYVLHEGMGQAASSTLGVAFLVDSAGHDSYRSGIQGRGGSRYGGIGQGGSTGVRYDPWENNPSLYGGVSFLYNGGGNNRFQTPWLGHGSAYFLGLGVLVVEGSGNTFLADFDSQGQGLHLSAGILLSKGGEDVYKGGWGSLGVGGDRSVGILINTGGNNHYEGTDQSVGTSRKPKALGIFIDTKGGNTYAFQKTSNTNLQYPQSPLEWSSGLFLACGSNNTYPQHVDMFERGPGLQWGIPGHSAGVERACNVGNVNDFLKQFPQTARIVFPFDPLTGWKSNTAYMPLEIASTQEEIQKQVKEILSADYERRRQLYESIDTLRFTYPNFAIDLSELLANPAEAPEDQFNYAVLWAVQSRQTPYLKEVLEALDQGKIASSYARKLAIYYVGIFGGEEADAVLGKVMLSDTSEENRAIAAGALARRSKISTMHWLEAGLHSDSEMVRYKIALGLEGRPLPGVLELVRPLFNDPSMYVRRAAAITALSLGDKQGVTVLLETLQYETLDTGDNYGNNLYSVLAKYLGVDFGLDRQAWLNWWHEAKETFVFPKGTLSP
ncbi:MAG: HEAT repeat domain-containing protein [Parachlamydiaceae bacterium]|nr:HEAT repeat domain-containing protein [Parachlamydiaceae bacterium]